MRLKTLMLTAFALMLGVTAEATDKWFWTLQAAGAADLAATELVLSRDQGVEHNPIHTGGTLATRAAFKVGTNAVVWWAARKLERDGHEGVAKALRWSGVAAQVTAAGWNVSVAVRF